MQYSTNVRKKDGGYQYIITYKQNGKWKTKSKQGFSKSSEAKDHMVDVIKELEKIVDSGVKTENVTLNDFKEEYIKHMELYKSPATIVIFKSAYKAYNLPNKEIGKITRMDIQKSIDSLIRANKIKISTIKKYAKIMQTFFNCAKKDYKLIVENPFDDLTFPSEKTEITRKALNKDELDKLLSDLKHNKYYLVILIAAKCGLRLGEIVGLTWDNIDMKNKTFNIVQQWNLINSNGSYGFTPLKSKNSNRVVPFPTTVYNELKKVNIRYVDNRLFNFKNTNVVGIMVNRYLKPYGISIHELRHTYATMLIQNGIDFKTAAALLGHDVEMTMKIYSHVNNDMMSRATNIINSIF